MVLIKAKVFVTGLDHIGLRGRKFEREKPGGVGRGFDFLDELGAAAPVGGAVREYDCVLKNLGRVFIFIQIGPAIKFVADLTSREVRLDR